MKKLTRWPYVAAGCIVIFVLGYLYSWSVFTVYFSKQFPEWTVSQLSFNFTLQNIFSCFAAYAGGKLLKKIPVKKYELISAGFIFLGLAILSLVEFTGSLFMVYLGQGVLTSFGIGMSYIVAVNAPPKWYPERSGFVSGLLLMFIGIGALVLGKIAEWLAVWVGFYNAIRIFAVVLAAIVVVCRRWLVEPGEGVALPASGRKSAAGDAKNYTTKEVKRLKSFWLFFFWNICLSAGGLIVINRAANIAVFYGVATVVGMLVSIMNSVGRLIFGAIADRWPSSRLMLLNNSIMLAAGVIMVGGILLTLPVLILVGLILTGAAFGGNLTLRVTVLADRYGPKYNAENFGVVNLCVIPASVLGPYVSGLLQDAQGGAYSGTFIMVIGLSVAAFILDFFYRRAKDKIKR